MAGDMKVDVEQKGVKQMLQLDPFVQVYNVDRVEIRRETNGAVPIVRVTIRGKDDNRGIQILAYPTGEIKREFNNREGIAIEVRQE